MRIEDKLYLIGYNINEEESHLGVSDPEECKKCLGRPCTYICPVGVYSYDDEEGRLSINYDACVECGTCRIVCSYITWKYPKGGFGVQYKFG